MHEYMNCIFFFNKRLIYIKLRNSRLDNKTAFYFFFIFGFFILALDIYYIDICSISNGMHRVALRG